MQIFSTRDFVLRYKNVNTILISFTVIGANSRNRVDRVKTTLT